MTHSVLLTFGVLVVVTVLGAWLEIRRVEVPVWLSVTGVSLGVGSNLFLNGVRGLIFAAAGLSLALATYLVLHLVRIYKPGGLKLMAPLATIVGPWNWMLICVLAVTIGLPVVILIALSTADLHKTGATKGMVIREFFQFLPPYQATAERRMLRHEGVTRRHGSLIAVGVLFVLAMTTIWTGK